MKKLGIFASLITLLTLNIALISDLKAKEKLTEVAAKSVGQANINEEMWADLKSDLYDNRKINKAPSWLMMEAPYRAHDAALVPITIKANLPKSVGKENKKPFLKALTLVIDNNPVPVAAKIVLSPKLGPLHMETRIRVNQYSHVRAIVETSEGDLFMVAKYVKAAGGCSAPAMKDIDAKMASIGKMKMRQFTPKPGTELVRKDQSSKSGTREIQLMVRHPNYSGMQLNQVTGYYIPAHFVNDMEVKLDEAPLIKLEGAISLSEDPMIRFRFQTDSAKPKLEFSVKDTKDQTFKKQWQLKPAIKAGS
ncbi:quinoprotein dehydrogenase-associated SoxYZ-like carrier [Hyphomicrobiales bacterium 4NK60-0047b]